MLQAVVWLIGLSIFASLIFIPSTGLLVFWNMLIPVAPALLVLGTGIWRNICPLATTTLLPRHWHVSRRKKCPSPCRAGCSWPPSWRFLG